MLPTTLDRGALPISLGKLADRIERAFFYAISRSTFKDQITEEDLGRATLWRTLAMLPRTSRSPPCLGSPDGPSGRER
jgi:hypothetical protein